MEHMEIDEVIVNEINDSAVNADSNNSADDMDVSKILGMLPVFLLLLIMFIRIAFVIYKSSGQKTRNSQQRRPYMGTRRRPSESQTEPTIYVSPANLPPPPKYEAMAPPSYEEVVGIHYPHYQPPVQPITQPITTALAQSSDSAPVNVTTIESQNNVNNVPQNEATAPSTVLTVTNERTVVTASS